MEYIAFDAHKHDTLASVVTPDGQLVREERIEHERGPCPQGQPLRYRRAHPTAHGDIYSTTPEQCRECPQKQRCTPGVVRRLFVHREEAARETVRALAGTPAYARSQRERYKVEALFAELKQRLRLGRLRLRRLWNAAEQFHLGPLRRI